METILYDRNGLMIDLKMKWTLSWTPWTE